MNKKKPDYKFIGIREGEKIHEVLINLKNLQEQKIKVNFINYQVQQSKVTSNLDVAKKKKTKPYTSETTDQLDQNQVLKS